ncbi:MAG: hypothetical protein WD231_03275 [Candidatus Woykebacteria bacterium]
METPRSFLYLALLHHGKLLVERLDVRERTPAAVALIAHWYQIGEISRQDEESLFNCWRELSLHVFACSKDKEQRREENLVTSRQDFAEVLISGYAEFRKCLDQRLAKAA